MNMKERLAIFGASLLVTVLLWLGTRITYYRATDPQGLTPGWSWVQEYFFWMAPWGGECLGMFVTLAMIIAGLATLLTIINVFVADPVGKMKETLS